MTSFDENAYGVKSFLEKKETNHAPGPKDTPTHVEDDHSSPWTEHGTALLKSLSRQYHDLKYAKTWSLAF